MTLNFSISHIFRPFGFHPPRRPPYVRKHQMTGQKLPDIDEPSQSICLPFSYVQRYVPVDNRREINALAVANPAGNSTDQSNTTEGIGTANPTSVQSVTPVSTANTASNLPSSPEDHAGIQPGPSAGGSGNSSAGIGTGGARNSTDLSGGCTGGSGGTGSSGPSSSSTGTNGAAPTASESPSKASAAGNSQNSGDLKRRMAVKTHHTYSMSSSNRSTTPTGNVNQNQISNDLMLLPRIGSF